MRPSPIPSLARPNPVWPPSLHRRPALRPSRLEGGWPSSMSTPRSPGRLEDFPTVHDPDIPSSSPPTRSAWTSTCKAFFKSFRRPDGRFEIVYVLNGLSMRAVEAEQVRPYVDTLAELTEHGRLLRPQRRRHFAKGGILFFLDDTGPERCVAAHLDESRSTTHRRARSDPPENRESAQRSRQALQPG